MSGENIGKIVAGILKDSVGGKARPAGIEGTIRLGEPMVLTKREVQEGQTSAVQAGQTWNVALTQEIVTGKPLHYMVDGKSYNTSEVINVRPEGNKLVVTTKTSIYELQKK